MTHDKLYYIINLKKGYPWYHDNWFVKFIEEEKNMQTYKPMIHLDRKNKRIVILDNQKEIYINSIKKLNLATEVVRKKASGDLLNAVANMASSSLGNGNEKVRVRLDFLLNDGTVEELYFNDEPIVKGNLEYHDLVRHARSINDAIKECM